MNAPIRANSNTSASNSLSASLCAGDTPSPRLRPRASTWRKHLARLALPVALLAAATTTTALAANCWDGTHPDGRYVVNSTDGTVKDSTTKLLWKQCVEGLSGSSCATGSRSKMNWYDGNSTASNSTQSGYNDWRMPSRGES